MYGLINQAIKDMVLTTPDGEQKWHEICQAVRVSEADFEALQPYQDSMTSALVQATAQKLNTSSEDILYKFGYHWISFTAEQGYGEIVDLFGKDFRTCLKNLNRMHGHMGAMMPALNPPRFTLTEHSPDRVTLHYFSIREGLGPMVVGLLDGLADKYGDTISIQFVPKGSRSDHDEFDITFQSV